MNIPDDLVDRHQLRIALLLSDSNLYPEEIEFIEEVNANPNFVVTLLLPRDDRADGIQKRFSRIDLSRDRRREWAMLLADKINFRRRRLQARIRRVNPPSREPKGQLATSDWLESTDHHFETQYIDEATEAGSSRSRVADEQSIDLVVQILHSSQGQSVVSSAPLGRLSVQYGREATATVGSIGFWEVKLREPSSAYQILWTSPEGRTLKVSESKYRTLTNADANRHSMLKRGLSSLLAEVERTAAERTPPAVSHHEFRNRSVAIAAYPPMLVSLVGIVSEPIRSLRSRGRRGHKGEWKVAISQCNWRQDFLESRLTTLVANPGCWYADPFLIEWNGKQGLLLEEYVDELGRGRISFVGFDGAGNFEQVIPVLTEDFHLSFPWTFEFEGDLYMIPETKGANQLRIYRCDSFPGQWSLVRTIFDGVQAVDPMVVQVQSGWYLFLNIDPLGLSDTYSELHIFHSLDPVWGTWQPLPRNPQVLDPERARNGGFLQEDGRIYRIGQRHAFGAYGQSLTIFEIQDLQPSGYTECSVKSVQASFPGAIRGPHHLSSNFGLTAFDYFE